VNELKPLSRDAIRGGHVLLLDADVILYDLLKEANSQFTPPDTTQLDGRVALLRRRRRVVRI